MQQGSWSVSRLCRVLNVHRSSYRYWRERSQKIEPQRLRLISELKRWFGVSNGSAGERTLVTQLALSGFKVSRWLVNKLMKQEGLVSRQLPAHKYAKSEKEHVLIPNVLGRCFSPKQPNQVWCGDVTYVWTGSRWLYLSLIHI